MTRKTPPLLRAGYSAAAVLCFACSSNVDLAGMRQKTNPQDSGDTGGAASTRGAATGGEANGGAATGGAPSGGAAPAGGNGNGGQATSADAGCRTGPQPTDLYVMFDQSQSMSTVVTNSNPPVTWWDAASDAISTFVQNPAVAGTGVGIQFFPFGGSIAGPDVSAPSSSCYVPNYATPEVEIGLLPGVAPAIVQAMRRHSPTTFTPTVAALRGAVEHMKEWGPAHPGRQPAVVLVTDGYPTECDPQGPLAIAQVAKEAFDNTPRVPTFVVGLEVGESLANLNVIALAGGTGHVHLIHGGDVGAELANDLLGISTTTPSCPP